MPRTLLQLVQQAANEIGIPEPSQLFGASDDTSKQLVALAQREGKEMAEFANDSGGWQALHKEYTFTTVGTQANYALPTDFAYFLNQTFWDNSYKWELLGPITAQQKNILKYGIVGGSIRRKFYVRANEMYLDPVPTVTGDIIAYDYYSNAWCQSSVGVAQSLWAADLDVYKLDEESFIKGIKWRYLRAQGLDYSQEYNDYMTELTKVKGRDGGSPVLSLVHGSIFPKLLDLDNTPDTGYGTI
jgi:hypothetical protein